MSPPVIGATRLRILQAAVVCVERSGLARTSLEDVAVAANLSRATVYRHFPGGRDQVITDVVAWEVGNFLLCLREAVVTEPGMESQLCQALIVGRRSIAEHRLLQQILSTEPEALIAELAETGPMIRTLVSDYLAEHLALEVLREGVDIAEAAEYLAIMYVSYLGSSGRSDLSDPAVVTRLVRTFFTAGIIAPVPADAS
jgi:AcrR family transcriptional regulator